MEFPEYAENIDSDYDNKTLTGMVTTHCQIKSKQESPYLHMVGV